MIDLHTHSFFSDGELIPSELVYRAKSKGYEAIAITDHVDLSNFELVIPRIAKISPILTSYYGIEVIPGAELTYVPPELIAGLARKCRKLGARLVLVHGETPAEPVPEGTNHAGVLSKIDILAHPGRMKQEDAELARKNGILLEITSRRGHSETNAYVAQLAKQVGAKLVFNTDTHGPGDLLNDGEALEIIREFGLGVEDLEVMTKNARLLLQNVRRTD